jgi:hypothetical protein
MPNMQGGMPNMQGGMPNMQGGMPNMQMAAGGALGMMGNLAPKAGMEHMSATDLLTAPTAQVLRLPDGHTVSIPFPPTPPDAPFAVNAGEIRAAAIIDHSGDILGVLGKLSGNRDAAKTLASFAKSEHLDKNFLKEWQKDPEKFDQFLQDHANDPGLAKLITLIQKDHEGGQIFKEIAADIDVSLKAYNDDVTQYETEYAQYQQAFTDHMSLMKTEILPQLSASGLISGEQLDHLLTNLVDQGGAIDFAQVAPGALVVDGGSGDNSDFAPANQGNAGDDESSHTQDMGDADTGSWGNADDGSAAVDSSAGDSSSNDFLASFNAMLADDSPSDASADSSEGWSDGSTDDFSGDTSNDPASDSNNS